LDYRGAAGLAEAVRPNANVPDGFDTLSG